jgi:glycosyltransferase involved in cell wall biosynthesis
VAPERDTRLRRHDFGIDPSAFMVFFNFDANSTIARKNPRAAIHAFRGAFGNGRHAHKAQLVMKSLNLSAHPEARSLVLHDLRLVGGLLIEEDLSAKEMASLVALADVYLSLHRAEGFGLGMAEAMYFGVPVVATAYSGNCDFMLPSNSCMVGYRPVPIDEADLRFNPGAERVYEPGQIWAEPNVDEAAGRMRYLHDNPRIARQISERGARYIRETYSEVAVGKVMRRRITEIMNGLSNA